MPGSVRLPTTQSTFPAAIWMSLRSLPSSILAEASRQISAASNAAKESARDLVDEAPRAAQASLWPESAVQWLENLHWA